MVATVGFFLFVELFLGLAGIEPVLYEQDPFVGFASTAPLFVEQTGANGKTYMVTAPGKLPWFNKQKFLKEKPAGTFRIFSLGGSTTYGRPYEDNASFSGWLRELLPLADPARKWEVINAGGISYASYRVAALMEQLLAYEPDLFIIYTGHNEFLERRTYQGVIEAPRVVTDLGAVLSRTRIYTAAQNLLHGSDDGPGVSHAGRTLLQSEVDEILAHSVGPEDYTRDDVFRGQVLSHFRYNLNRMVDMARSVEAELLFVTPAANWKDVSPFKSEHRESLTREAQARFDELSSIAQEARKADDFSAALAALDQAAAIDDRYAELHFRRGEVLYELGRYSEAAKAFRRALDEDICPLRALTSIREIVVDVAGQKSVPVADFAVLIEERSPHGIPGSEHFLDHVHLTVEGYRLLALRLIDALREEDILDFANTWNDESIAAVTEKVAGRIDKQAQGIALRNLAKVFHWAGKVEEAESLASRAVSLLGTDAESFAMLGRSAAARGDVKEAIHHYKRALDINPRFAEAHYNLGFLLMSEGRLAEASRRYQEALRVRPDYAEAHRSMGIVLARQRKQEAAMHHFGEALRLEPDSSETHYHLAGVLMLSGRYQEARKHYLRAIELQPDYAEAYNNLGSALMSLSRSKEAIEQFQKALALNPDHAAAHYNLGNALLQEKNLREAARHFREVIRVTPESPVAHASLGSTLGMLQKHHEAAKHLKKALRLNPNNPTVRQNLVLALRAQGKQEEAMRIMRSSAKP